MITSFCRLPHRLARCVWKTFVIQSVKVILQLCPTKDDVQRVIAFGVFLVLVFILIGIFLGSQERDMTKIDFSPQRQEYLIEKYKQELAEREKFGEHPLFADEKGVTKKQNRSVIWDGDIGNDLEDSRKLMKQKDTKELDRDSFLDNLEDYNKEEKDDIDPDDPEVNKEGKDDIDPDDPEVNKEVLDDVIRQRFQKKRGNSVRKRLGDRKNVQKRNNISVPNIKSNKRSQGQHFSSVPHYCQVYNLNSSISEQYDCIFLNFSVPKVPICLYPDSEDIHVSAHLRREGIWEGHLVSQFRDFLLRDRDIGFVDIGANLGLYSLIAARLGHHSVSVEPFMENVKHFQRAIQIGGFQDRITIVQNAISDRREEIPLIMRRDNQGGIALDVSQENQEKHPCTGGKCPTTESIYMDDLLEVVTFDKAIIKIDIEGHEHRAFRESSRFFNQVHVPYIFMEWIKLRGYYGTDLTQSEDKTLTWELVRYLVDRGYEPHSSVNGRRLEHDYWFGWGDDIIWKLKKNEQH